MKFAHALYILGLAASSQALMTESELRGHFQDFMEKYDKTYDHDEFLAKYETFKDNMEFIHTFSSDSFTVAVNEFADMTSEEFVKQMNGLRLTAEALNAKQSTDLLEVVDVEALPASVDWRQKGAVTPVKNQGQCGSCWSFSTTGSVEGAHVLSGQGDLTSLSEQNLMDCSWNEGNQGCNGGLMDDAFKYIISNKGIDTETSYPYTARDGSCQYNAQNSGATIDSYMDVQSGSESALQDAVANKGPVSVAIDASHSSFQFYSGGVYYEPACSSTALDHGVLAIGYGTDNGKDFWLVKNSWGTSWGMQGFIQMSRNRNNNCGIATASSYPVINQ